MDSNKDAAVPVPVGISSQVVYHEEADRGMMLHSSHAAQQGHHKIMIRTVDTEVVVMAVSVAQGLKQKMNCGWHLELARIFNTCQLMN